MTTPTMCNKRRPKYPVIVRWVFVERRKEGENVADYLMYMSRGSGDTHEWMELIDWPLTSWPSERESDLNWHSPSPRGLEGAFGSFGNAGSLEESTAVLSQIPSWLFAVFSIAKPFQHR